MADDSTALVPRPSAELSTERGIVKAVDSNAYGRHFKHCYAYEGTYCSCGGTYTGDEAGPALTLPPRPFSLVVPERPSKEVSE